MKLRDCIKPPKLIHGTSSSNHRPCHNRSFLSSQSHVIAVGLLLLATGVAAADFCDLHPLISVTEQPCPENRQYQLMISLQRTFRNPFHAIHDMLWALSYYLANCLPPGKKDLIIKLKNSTEKTLAECQDSEGQLPELARYGIPCWEIFMVHAIAKSHGAKVVDSGYVEGCVDKNVNFCWSVKFDRNYDVGMKVESDYERKTVQPHFREVKWWGRGCVDPKKDIVCQNPASQDDIEPQLPEEFKMDAFRRLRECMWDFIGIPKDRPGGRSGPVRVLLYDRNDTGRRQWARSNDFYERIRDDSRMKVRYMRVTPKTPAEQAKIYAWADLVLGPAGAAMANTIFMRPKSEIIEINKNCGHLQLVPHEWTAWHIPMLDLSFKLVECIHLSHDPVLKKGPRLIHTEQALEALEAALMRLGNWIDIPEQDIIQGNRTNERVHVAHEVGIDENESKLASGQKDVSAGYVPDMGGDAQDLSVLSNETKSKEGKGMSSLYSDRKRGTRSGESVSKLFSELSGAKGFALGLWLITFLLFTVLALRRTKAEQKEKHGQCDRREKHGQFDQKYSVWGFDISSLRQRFWRSTKAFSQRGQEREGENLHR